MRSQAQAWQCSLSSGKGTATLVKVRLPVSPHLKEPKMADTKTILVVDDDMELSDGLRAVLERQGHRVIQARDGQQGKQMVYQHHPDLVILDMMMPRMGGYPVLEHFRGKADAPPIIMITANEGSRHKAYAEYLGVVDYIRKPFAMERLLESVQKGRSGGAGGEPPKSDEK
jgi:DNA-binding response OmpR family regulator